MKGENDKQEEKGRKRHRFEKGGDRKKPPPQLLQGEKVKHDEKDNKRTSGFFLLSLKKWGEEGKEPEWGGRKKGGMGRKEEDTIISFEKMT